VKPQTVSLRLTVNGDPFEADVSPSMHLVDFLRERLDLTGSHLGCEHGVCGACSVMVDNTLVRGCLMLACQAEGKEVRTIEGISDSGDLQELQQAFLQHNALQCGFCTPGMLLTALDLVRHHPDASREEIRDYISGNYCRCTGYQAIVNAVESVLTARKKAVAGGAASAASAMS